MMRAALAAGLPASLLPRLRGAALTVLSHGSSSLGFFVVNLLLIRGVAPSAFGSFAVVMALLPFAANLFGAVAIYPTTLRLTAPGARVPAVLGAALATGLLLSLPIAAAIGVVGFFLAGVQVAAAAALATLAWTAQVMASRALMAQRRIGEAAVGDLICNLGMPIGVAALFWLAGPSILWPFVTLGLSAALALLVQARRCAVTARDLKVSLPLVREWWELGRYSVIGPLCEGGMGQLVIWTLLATRGSAAVAVFAALRSLIGVANPLLFSVQTFIVPVVSRVRHQRGGRAAVREGLLAGAPLLIGISALLLGVALFAERLITVVYGASWDYAQYDEVLRLFALSCFVLALAECMAAVFRGLGRVGMEARTQLAGLAGALLIGLPLVAAIGLAGAPLVFAIAAMMRVLAGMHAARVAVREAAA